MENLAAYLFGNVNEEGQLEDSGLDEVCVRLIIHFTYVTDLERLVLEKMSLIHI